MITLIKKGQLYLLGGVVHAQGRQRGTDRRRNT